MVALMNFGFEKLFEKEMFLKTRLLRDNVIKIIGCNKLRVPRLFHGGKN